MQTTTWRPVSTIFFGGTQAALALKGRRVRTAVAMTRFPLYDPINPRNQRMVDLAPAWGSSHGKFVLHFSSQARRAAQELVVMRR